LIGLVVFLAAGCTRSQPGFSVGGSVLRYETAELSDPGIIAKAGDIEVRREEVAGNSAVIGDLDRQMASVRAALVYKKVLSEMRKGETGRLIIYYSVDKPDVEAGLSLLGINKHPGIEVALEPRASGDAVGFYNEKEILSSDVETDHVALREIEKRRFLEIGNGLNKKIVNLAVKREARNLKMTDQDFVEQKILSGMPQPTAAEFREYLDSVGEVQESLSEDLLLRHRIAFEARLRERRIEEFVIENIVKTPVQIAMAPPAPDLKLDMKMDPAMGLEESPISLVVFASAGCEDCKQTVEVVNSVMQEFAGDLRLNWIFHHTINDTQPLERAAICVETFEPRQMLDFLSYVDSTVDELDNRVWTAWIDDRNIDQDEFRNCLLSDSTTKILNQHHSFSAASGVLQNPSVWINGQLLTGSIRLGSVEKVIKDKIRERGEGWIARSWRHVKAWVLRRV
jgi:hypothetical protein